MKIDKCRACRADIVWVRMGSGKSNPLDAKPSDKGNVLVAEDTMTGRVVTNSELREAIERKTPLYISHFATCPEAGKLRKK